MPRHRKSQERRDFHLEFKWPSSFGKAAALENRIRAQLIKLKIPSGVGGMILQISQRGAKLAGGK